MKNPNNTKPLVDNKDSVDEAVDHITKLPHKEQQQVVAKLEMTSGPIPHPDILSRYDELDPGAAKLIIENGVEESAHRRTLESRAMEYSRRDHKRRDIMGFTIGLVGMSIGALLIWLEHTVTGTIFSGVSLVMLVGLFVGSNDSDNVNDNQDSDSE